MAKIVITANRIADKQLPMGNKGSVTVLLTQQMYAGINKLTPLEQSTFQKTDTVLKPQQSVGMLSRKKGELEP